MFTVTSTELEQLIKFVVFDHNEPLMIWGQPGGGKSFLLGTTAAQMNAHLVVVMLGQYDTVDLRGLPDLDGDVTTWRPASTLPFKDTSVDWPTDRPILLFFDEINGASKAVSGAAYQIILDRKLGDQELMDNVYIVAAGNRETDKGVTNRMPTPLANRFTHVELGLDVDAWTHNFAIPHNMPPEGIAFLQFRKALLTTFDPTKADKAFATPRTWEKAFKYYMGDASRTLKMAAMAGAVGDGPMTEFWGFVDIWKDMIPIADIIANPMGVPLPEGENTMAMTYALATACSGEMSLETVKPLHMFLERLKPEFVVMAWQLAIRRDGDLLTTDEFMKMATDYRAIFQS